MNHLTRARSVFEMEIEELRGVLSRLDENFNKAVDLMSRALDRGNKIVIAGVGKSGNVGAKIVATLNSTGTPTVMLDSLNALHGDLGIVQDGDVCIAMSFSGETTELLTLLPFIKRLELPVISMTGNIHSSLAKYSDVVLDTGVSREACPLNLAPTSSTTAMLVMGDALAMALVEARHFTAKDFAKRHPGGSLGRALLTKVSDFMRQGDEMAILPETASFNDRPHGSLHPANGGRQTGRHLHPRRHRQGLRRQPSHRPAARRRPHDPQPHLRDGRRPGGGSRESRQQPPH